MNPATKRRPNVVEQQALTVQAALRIGGLLVYHEIRLCTKNPVSMLTYRSIRPFWLHFESFFEARETYFYT